MRPGVRPAAQLGTSILNLKKGKVLTIPVKEINLAEGIGPFIYQPADADPALGASDAPAQITGFSPANVSNGEILTTTYDPRKAASGSDQDHTHQ